MNTAFVVMRMIGETGVCQHVSGLVQNIMLFYSNGGGSQEYWRCLASVTGFVGKKLGLQSYYLVYSCKIVCLKFKLRF